MEWRWGYEQSVGRKARLLAARMVAGFMALAVGLGCSDRSSCTAEGCDIADVQCTSAGDISGGPDAACPACPDRTGDVCPKAEVAAETDASSCPEAPLDPCAKCPAGGYCQAGHCYDCSEEGFCNAVECKSDSNPCTLEIVDPATGGCRSVPNEACREPIENLVRIFRGAQAYYGLWIPEGDKCVPAKPRLGQVLPLKEGPTPEAGSCCSTLSGPDADGDGYCDPDPTRFRTAVWRFLHFDLRAAHRYAYSFDEQGDGTRGAELFGIVAQADLDCDGKGTKFVLRGGFGDGADCQYSGRNLLGEPTEIEYVSESGQSLMMSAGWGAATFAAPVGSPEGPFRIPPQETFFHRYLEPVSNLMKIHSGARRYYQLPKAEMGAPACQLTPADQALMSQFPDAFPKYVPLAADWTPAEQTCCPGGGRDLDGDGLCDPCCCGCWSFQAWRTLGFRQTGKYRYAYDFQELPPLPGPKTEGDEVFSIQARAKADLNCDENPVAVAFEEAFFMHKGICATAASPLSPDERMPPNLEFFPFEDTSMCAVLPSYPQHKSDLWLEEIWQDSSFALDKTTLEPGMIFQEPIATLQKAQTAFDAYFGSYCSPPAAPPPEYLGVCCPAWVTDPWYTSTPLCQQVSSDWSADFWKQIGFFASGPQNFVYDALVTPLGANQWLVSLGAHYTLNCSTPFEGSLTRFGIAQKVGNGCAVKWLQGWHVVDMME